MSKIIDKITYKFSWNKIKFEFSYGIPTTIRSIILCIRFPFLYPRNRWTGKHYTNWKIVKFHRDHFQEAFTAIPIGELDHNITKHGVLDLFTINPGKKYLAYKILVLDWINDNILPIFHCIPRWNELGAMPEGWRKAFGIQMCKEIKKELIKNHALYGYRITQIKEKLGYLHWYDNGYYGTKDSNIPKIIEKYSKLSLKTCINCGKPSTCFTCGWISPYCDDCKTKQVYKTYKTYNKAYEKTFCIK